MFKSSTRRPLRAGPREKVERRLERVPVTKAASISADGGDQLISCTLRDINAGGARMSVMDMNVIPDTFMLICRAEDLVARAKTAWKRNNEVGVKFLRRGTMINEEQFRREQAASSQRAHQEAAASVQQQQSRADAEAQMRAEAARRAAMELRAAQMQAVGLDPRLPFTEDDLKRAFRKQAMLKHPDQGGDPDEFQKLNDMYQALLASFAPQPVPQPNISL